MSYIPLDEAAAKLYISRDTLDKMIRAAPGDLPGAPVDFGSGRKRLLRFRADALETWVEAYKAWKWPTKKAAKGPKYPLTAKKKRAPAAAPPNSSSSAPDGTGKITSLEVERLRRSR